MYNYHYVRGAYPERHPVPSIELPRNAVPGHLQETFSRQIPSHSALSPAPCQPATFRKDLLEQARIDFQSLRKPRQATNRQVTNIAQNASEAAALRTLSFRSDLVEKGQGILLSGPHHACAAGCVLRITGCT